MSPERPPRLGNLTVIDEVAFRGPQSFGLALITFDEWRRTGPTRFLVFDGDNALRVDVCVEGGELELVPETIEEEVRVETQPTRIGINLKAPARRARVAIRGEPHTQCPRLHASR